MNEPTKEEIAKVINDVFREKDILKELNERGRARVSLSFPG